MKDCYYFSHDSNANSDPKCVLLIEQLGLEGYGIFWVLIETLRDQPTYRYPVKLLSALARRFNTSSEKIRTVIMSYGLFTVENEEFFYSQSLIDRMNIWDKNKEIRSIAGKKGNEKRWSLPSQTDRTAIANGSQTDRTAIAIREEKNKEDKIKGKENREEGINLTPYEIFLKEEKIFNFENLEFLNSEMWFESKAMQLSSETIILTEKAKEFLIDVRDRDMLEGKTLIDLRSHFVSWYKKKRESEKTEKPVTYRIPKYTMQ